MNTLIRNLFRAVLVLIILMPGFAGSAGAWTPKAVQDDPLVRMPGTQPGQVTLESPKRCLNCHSGYDPAVEPGTNWQGSMMAQAARDFLFWACLTVAGQDSIWATGHPNAVDICERCHFPQGWLEGRSDPPNASAMTGSDFDGVQCDFCHRLVDPFFATTFDGSREGNDWLIYWDETNASDTPSLEAADVTYTEDAALASAILNFNGSGFFEGLVPPENYLENGSGQYFVSPDAAKRASFADAAARHQMLYSRYHKSRYFCSTCHDVSNPVLANLGADETLQLPTELNSAFSFFHVERTFSEFMLSAYGQQGGAPTNTDFRAQGAPNITHATKCQDCHMRDTTGVACNKKGVPVRPNESIEHPDSGQPLHDLTGGNVWVSTVLASAVPGSPNHDQENDNLLNQGSAILTLDLTQGLGIDPTALLAGAERAREQLLLAATIKDLNYDPATGLLNFKVQNNSGHKLISGFPEGRRMFVNIRAYDAEGSMVEEVNPYDYAAGTLKGLDYSYQPGDEGLPGPQPLSSNELYLDELVYEMHPSSSLTGETETFHFALADGRYKDNRIPPKGFRIGEAAARLSVPVWHGTEDPGYFSSAEYAGGFDDVSLGIATGASYVEVNLYYQTTSREYIEFLRDEINGTGHTLSGNGVAGDPAYLIQGDSFFSQLKAWGDTIWTLWTHNMNLDGARPFLMASATTGTPTTCDIGPPTLNSADPGHTQVTLEWMSPVAGVPDGYKVYYDQAGKAQLVADVGPETTFIDADLTNGVEYCYKVTAYGEDCESEFSNILCATPTNQGQQTETTGADAVETGIYSGKGKNQSYSPQTSFTAGDDVTVRVTVVDVGTGLPLDEATVDLLVTGPESTTLTTGPSNADGLAEATWKTKADGKRNPGTPTGSYSVQVSGVTANGYQWDGIQTSTTFILQ